MVVLLCILLVCDGFIILIVSFKIIFSMKGGYLYVWKCVSFAGMFFNVIINVIIFLVLKGVMGVFVGWVEMCEYCGYAFWNLKVYKRKNAPGSSISYYCSVSYFYLISKSFLKNVLSFYFHNRLTIIVHTVFKMFYVKFYSVY